MKTIEVNKAGSSCTDELVCFKYYFFPSVVYILRKQRQKQRKANKNLSHKFLFYLSFKGTSSNSVSPNN